jgi:molecular chaperone HtpG
MAKKQFKAESRRLLDLMIHSIYTHKEIFLRELISNASDAIDKMYYRALTDESISFNKEEFYIRIALNKKTRTLTISDTGIGMTREELDDNLGIIAKSGSLEFKKDNEVKDGVDIIGQFGVGFYSAFMVADVVTVQSRAFGSDEAYQWRSKGADGYTIEPCSKATVGTDIILKIKESTEDEKYDDYLEEYRVRSIIRKYSDFIRYPITMNIKSSRLKDGSDSEYEEFIELQTINSMVPIWKKNKNELTSEDYDLFYEEKHYGFDKPVKHLHISVDGAFSYNAILYIPEKPPYDFYTRDYEKGLELYASGVLIMNKCADLLPDHFSFVKGLVDSEDLSLNISRELLQHDRQLKLIAKNITGKISKELESLMKNEREKYEKFYDSFGKQLKFGVYNEYGNNADQLKDLLLFPSSKEKKLVSFSEYTDRMPEEQKFIYYAAGDSVGRIEKMPQTEMVLEKGYEILYFTDDVDEFAIRMLTAYNGKEFRSVSGGDLGIDADEKELADNLEEENKELFDYMRNLLSDKVKDVRASKRLKHHPVCLSNEGELSVEMEKILNTMPGNEKIKADKTLEINTSHEVFQTLLSTFKQDKEKLDLYTMLLYNLAFLIEGLAIDDPAEFSNDVCRIMK